MTAIRRFEHFEQIKFKAYEISENYISNIEVAAKELELEDKR